MTVTKEHLQAMFDFVCWADNQMLAASRSVPDEGYYKEQGISIGSIHKLLAHSMAAQWIWLSRWRGESPTRLETHEDYPTRDSVMLRWPLVHSAITDFLGTQSPKALARDVQYRNTRGELFSLPLGELMLHVIDHAAYHRGQINTMIKHAGGQPGNVSFQVYSMNKAQAAVNPTGKYKKHCHPERYPARDLGSRVTSPSARDASRNTTQHDSFRGSAQFAKGMEMTSTEIQTFDLVEDAQHKLILKRPGEEDVTDVRIRRSFPWSQPAHFVSIRSSEGKELVLIEDLASLDSTLRARVEAWLTSHSFIPKITRIDEVDVAFGYQEWHVQTDRGPARFRVQEREDIRFLHDGRFSVKDADGNVYEMTSLEKLDPQSRSALEALL